MAAKSLVNGTHDLTEEIPVPMHELDQILDYDGASSVSEAPPACATNYLCRAICCIGEGDHYGRPFSPSVVFRKNALSDH